MYLISGNCSRKVLESEVYRLYTMSSLVCGTCRKYETRQREFQFSSPTNIYLSFLGGGHFLNLAAAKHPHPHQPPPKLPKCPLAIILALCSLLALMNSKVGWFQDCRMRRNLPIRLGSPGEGTPYLFRLLVMLCAQSGRTMKMPVAKTR